MENNTKKTQLPMRIIGAVVLVIIVSGLTVLLLSVLSPKKPHIENTPVQSISATSIIDQYKTKAFHSDQYAAGGNPLLGSSIIAKPDDGAYSVTTDATSFVSYQRTDNKQATNDATVISQAEDFLEGIDMKKISSNTQNGITYEIFKNDETTCQIASVKAVGTSPASFGVGCTATTDINKSAETSKKLLSLYTDSAPLMTFTSTSISSTTSNKQTITILYLHDQNAPAHISSLFFLTHDDQQTYLGMRSTPSGDDGAPVQSPTLTESLSNKEYGDTLKNILEKY